MNSLRNSERTRIVYLFLTKVRISILNKSEGACSSVVWSAQVEKPSNSREEGAFENFLVFVLKEIFLSEFLLRKREMHLPRWILIPATQCLHSSLIEEYESRIILNNYSLFQTKKERSKAPLSPRSQWRKGRRWCKGSKGMSIFLIFFRWYSCVEVSE